MTKLKYTMALIGVVGLLHYGVATLARPKAMTARPIERADDPCPDSARLHRTWDGGQAVNDPTAYPAIVQQARQFVTTLPLSSPWSDVWMAEQPPIGCPVAEYNSEHGSDVLIDHKMIYPAFVVQLDHEPGSTYVIIRVFGQTSSGVAGSQWYQFEE